MDASGNNRFGLLFMDDDSTSVNRTEQVVVPVPAPKQQSAGPGPSAAKKNVLPKKSAMGNEKENKANVMNKDNNAKSAQSGTHSDQSRNSNRQFSMKNERVASEGNNYQRNDDRNRGGFAGRNAAGDGSNEKTPRQFNNNNRDNRNQFRPRGNGEKFGKREFDRQSGSDKTGVKSVDKREGAGAHNWGSIKQEIDDIDNGRNDVDTSVNEKDEFANEQSAEQNVAAVEEEAKVMTLDEWKALTQQTRSKPQYNIRKAGEGEDVSQWKKMIVLNKKKDESDEEFEFDPSLYPQRVGRLQRITDIQFNFNDNRRGFGGRRRGGGGGGRDGPREGGRDFRDNRDGGRDFRDNREGGRDFRDNREGGRDFRDNREGGRDFRDNREGGRDFRDNRDGGRDKGARFESRNQRYSDKVGKGNSQQLKVDDENQFPTLG